MKLIVINRRFAFVILFVIICFCGITYFATLSSGLPVANFDNSYKRSMLTLVIDPGHGGEDGGSVSKNGTIESNINLSIALKTEALCAFLGIEPVMTRETAEIDYPPNADTTREKKVADQKARLALINNTSNAVLISIHQNCYTSSGPYGGQVLYAPTDGSREFGEYIQNIMLQHLITNNRRTAALISEDIYLMNNISCPAVLIECGFLSNANEEQLLISDSYQLKIAAIIASSYNYNIDELSSVYGG